VANDFIHLGDERETLFLQYNYLCCLSQPLGYGLSGSNFFQFMAYEAYKESVTFAHLIWVWVCEARRLYGFSMFCPILQNFLNAHPFTGDGLGRAFLNIG